MYGMTLQAGICVLSVHGTTTRRQLTCMTIRLLRLRYILGVAARRYNVLLLLLLIVSMYATTIAWTRIRV